MSESDDSTDRDTGQTQPRIRREGDAVDEHGTMHPDHRAASVPVEPQARPPLIVWIGNETQLEFHRDQNLIIVRRRNSKDSGQEIFPVEQIVSVGVEHQRPPEQPMGVLTIHLSTGRTVSVEFAGRFTSKVEEFQRAITGAPEPEPARFPRATCLGLLIGFVAITLFSLLVARLFTNG